MQERAAAAKSSHLSETERAIVGSIPGGEAPSNVPELHANTETEFTKPVDFHSFRRSFKQALADAGVDVQQAMALSGASDMKAHARYLANTAKMRTITIPKEALPNLSIVHAENPEAEKQKPRLSPRFLGAGEEIRTLDVNLGNSKKAVSSRYEAFLSNRKH